MDGGSTCPSDFYTPELREFIMPWESATADAVSPSTINKDDSSVQPTSEGATVTGTKAPILPASSQTVDSTPGTNQLPLGSQTLRDLIELAEDSMTLTQCGYAASGPGKDLSKSEEQADLCVSGFLTETTHAASDNTQCQTWVTDRQGAETERWSQPSVATSRLASDLSSMVNNPQLCDVQLQVDSGEVYFAHSFMVYARCPLLAEMVNESGFGVQEDGMPAAQRVLMNDVPGQAVFALLQYLYTAHCSVPASLRPHVLELASRFGLQELQQLCELGHDDAATREDEESCMNQEENVNQTDQFFIELLSSMWNEEDEDSKDKNAEEGSYEERASEENGQASDLTAGDREICEEKVNEEELEEIYEFAATQRKKEEENDSMEEKDSEEEENEDEDGKQVFTKLTEPKRTSTDFNVKNLKPNLLLEPDSSLDRSYSRLFSESWGVYEEAEPSSLLSASGQTKMHVHKSPKHQSNHKPSSKLPDKSLLHSSASAIDDLSLSPASSTSHLPSAGRSPCQAAADADMSEEGIPLEQESQGPHSTCAPRSPEALQMNKEPELIVLSDSSDEMEVILSSGSPSPPPLHTNESRQSYTEIRPQPVLTHHQPTHENKRSSSLEFSPDGPSAAPVHACDPSAMECSPEVSWLIPSTPVQQGRSTKTSSTQTRSSMCRTQLFTKEDNISPTPLTLKSRLQTDTSLTTHLSHVESTEEHNPRIRLADTVPRDPSFDLGDCPTTNSCDVSEVRETNTVASSQSKRSHLSNSTSPLHVQPQPYSSTPLHTELHQPPAPLSSSLLASNLDKQRSASQGSDKAASDSPEKAELGSFHFSPLSDPSDPNCSSPHRDVQSSRRRSDSSRQSGRTLELDSRSSTRTELVRRNSGDEGEQSGATGEARAAESSFRQSFVGVDDPPIAFNDSWGLDVCAEADLGFSLKLEDSGGSHQQEHSPTRREIPRLSTSPGCPPSSPAHSVPLLNSRCCAAAASPSKPHSPQPSTSMQANADPSCTPSPPDPTNRTAPEISNSLLDSKIWDSWEEEEEEEPPPLSQRINPSAQLITPAPAHKKRRRTLVPITPMPHYSDLDTPDLKNKLNRFGVRPLPKRQMILKLKEIHQYTHQLVSSDSDDEAPSAGCTAQMRPPPSRAVASGSSPLSCAQTVTFQDPAGAAVTSPLKDGREEEAEQLSASQASHTSSTGASEESERSNPELCLSSDGNSDGNIGISASQRATCLQDRLQAVRAFILSDSELYTQILHYQPLVLSQLHERLKASGIRLGAAKLADYLDSQCITFTTAKPGRSAPSRRRPKRTGKPAKAAAESGASRKRGVTAIH